MVKKILDFNFFGNRTGPLQIISSALVTSCGTSKCALIDAIYNKKLNHRVFSARPETKKSLMFPSFYEGAQYCPLPSSFYQKANSARDVFFNLFDEIFSQLKSNTPGDFDCGKMGIIFCSTKGATEDYLGDAAQKFADPIHSVLDSYLINREMSFAKSICISNACSSSHVGVFLANKWLLRDEAEEVIVISSDLIGSFVASGFNSLKALGTTPVRPFDAKRDGLLLGEACAAVVFGKNRGPLNTSIGIKISKVGFITDPGATIRPNAEGESLYQVVKNHGMDIGVDAIIAHATSTPANDLSEAKAYERLFPKNNIPITASKWCIGHTMGASGLIDLILAVDSIESSRLFPISTLQEKDPLINSLVINETLNTEFNNILVSSLGFGGIAAAFNVIKGN